MTTDEELKGRIKALELFKHDLEKKLYAAWAVASILGIAGLLGGAWLTTMSGKVQILAEKTAAIESNLAHWEATVITAKESIEKAKLVAEREIESRSGSLLEELILRLDAAADQKRSEIEDLTPQDLLTVLQDGSTSLVLNGLTVSNDIGNSVFYVGADNGGDGYMRLNSGSGDIRYRIRLANDRPISDYWNADGDSVLSLGAYKNSSFGFLRVFDPESQKAVLQIGGLDEGGEIKVYSDEGDVRYRVNLVNGRPVANFWNSAGAITFSQGIYNDSDSGFMRIFDQTTEKFVVNIDRSGQGGRARFYSNSGEQIVYIGPESQSGNGLVNVLGLHGESTNSHSPTK